MCTTDDELDCWSFTSRIGAGSGELSANSIVGAPATYAPRGYSVHCRRALKLQMMILANAAELSHIVLRRPEKKPLNEINTASVRVHALHPLSTSLCPNYMINARASNLPGCSSLG